MLPLGQELDSQSHLQMLITKVNVGKGRIKEKRPMGLAAC
jgi:hypothetical protein